MNKKFYPLKLDFWKQAFSNFERFQINKLATSLSTADFKAHAQESQVQRLLREHELQQQVPGLQKKGNCFSGQVLAFLDNSSISTVFFLCHILKNWTVTFVKHVLVKHCLVKQHFTILTTMSL